MRSTSADHRCDGSLHRLSVGGDRADGPVVVAGRIACRRERRSVGITLMLSDHFDVLVSSGGARMARDDRTVWHVAAVAGMGEVRMRVKFRSRLRVKLVRVVVVVVVAHHGHGRGGRVGDGGVHVNVGLVGGGGVGMVQGMGVVVDGRGPVGGYRGGKGGAERRTHHGTRRLGRMMGITRHLGSVVYHRIRGCRRGVGVSRQRSRRRVLGLLNLGVDVRDHGNVGAASALLVRQG